MKKYWIRRDELRERALGQAIILCTNGKRGVKKVNIDEVIACAKEIEKYLMEGKELLKVDESVEDNLV